MQIRRDRSAGPCALNRHSGARGEWLLAARHACTRPGTSAMGNARRPAMEGWPSRRFEEITGSGLRQFAPSQPPIQLERLTDNRDRLVRAVHVVDAHLLVLECRGILEEAPQRAHQMRGRL